MLEEEKKTKFLPQRMLAARESMRTFFQHWIEDDSLLEAWRKHKIDAGQAIAAFLQEYSVILAEPNGADKQAWFEQSINKLEELEKLQLRQRFLTGRATWNSDGKEQTITLTHTEKESQKQKDKIHSGASTETEAMIFMPEVGKYRHVKADITDMLRKGLTNARAFLNIANLSNMPVTDEMQGRLEVWLQVFKNHIHLAYKLQKESNSKWLRKNKGSKDALAAYNAFLEKLGEILVQSKIYDKVNDACKGIVHMADFLWSKNYEKSSIHIQQSSKNHANIIVFEPRFVKGSGNKEASWVKKLTKKHPWIKHLPWQVLQRPRALFHRDGEGLKTEKVTLVSVKKTEGYAVDCTPIGELGGIPVPLTMRDLTERYNITLANQKGTYLGSQAHDDEPPFAKLEEVIFTQVEMLAPIIIKARRKKGITIPLADINLTRKAFLYKEASISWLQDRVDANHEIRHILKRYAIYYDDAQEEVIYLDKTLSSFAAEQASMMASDNCMPIHIEFHDPTIIYSRSNTFPCKTREDIYSLKAGLKVAIERLEMLKETLSELNKKMYRRDIEDLGTVQAFLKSRSLGFYRPQAIPDSVIEATRYLSEKLRRPECPLKNNPNSSRKMQVEMLKILQSSLIVKSESFESFSAFSYRLIDTDLIGAFLITPGNKCLKKMLMADETFSKLLWALCCALISPFFMTGWTARFFMALGAGLSNMPHRLYYGVQKIWNSDRNRSRQLTAAVSILFSAMGKKKLNCKNTADYALSVLLTSGAMIHHAIHGALMDGKVPLMTDDQKYAPEKILARKAIKYQQSLKATGL